MLRRFRFLRCLPPPLAGRNSAKIWPPGCVRSLRGQWRTISCCSSRCCCRLARTRCCRRQLQDRRCSGEAGRPCTGEAPLLGHTHTLPWRALSAPTIPICLGPRLAALGTIPAERPPHGACVLRSTAPLLAAEGTPPPPQAAWRLGDELDKRIASLALPAVVSFMILPIAQATDLFWVGRMGEALAVASRRLPSPPVASLRAGTVIAGEL